MYQPVAVRAILMIPGRLARWLLAATLLLLISTGCTHSKSSAPDLDTLVKQLTSADLRTQEQALVPAVQAPAGRPAGVLPAGSTLQVEPKTWQVTGADSKGAPTVGRIRASLTRPGEPASKVYLDLAKVDGKWLLYETGPA
jgi:hypothetical protein